MVFRSNKKKEAKSVEKTWACYGVFSIRNVEEHFQPDKTSKGKTNSVRGSYVIFWSPWSPNVWLDYSLKHQEYSENKNYIW